MPSSRKAPSGSFGRPANRSRGRLRGRPSGLKGRYRDRYATGLRPALDPGASTAPSRTAARAGAAALPTRPATAPGSYQDQIPTNKSLRLQGIASHCSDVFGGALCAPLEWHSERVELLLGPSDATPSVSRLPLNRSRLAASLATITGLCSGSSSTPVATSTRDEVAAAKLNAIIGSSQSACAGTAMTPSRE